ncbi:helix-turn-helix domain-containing protein [Congregibacter sp.]|uniref:helix-turn-helix domain-containing protein n=1 Tax=Congregibacter sp. TaxID=2744308 RepID=UPI003F6D48C4
MIHFDQNPQPSPRHKHLAWQPDRNSSPVVSRENVRTPPPKCSQSMPHALRRRDETCKQLTVEPHAIPLEHPPEKPRTGILDHMIPASTVATSKWDSFARYQPHSLPTEHCPGADEDLDQRTQRQDSQRRQPCGGPTKSENKTKYLPLSRTTDRVLRILLDDDLSRVRAESVAETLGISCTTLRRRLRNDHTSYQFLLDRARQYRCESRLRERWLPGKCLADELGYLEVNSFYRAFRRWTGLSYSDYRQRYH